MTYAALLLYFLCALITHSAARERGVEWPAAIVVAAIWPIVVTSVVMETAPAKYFGVVEP